MTAFADLHPRETTGTGRFAEKQQSSPEASLAHEPKSTVVNWVQPIDAADEGPGALLFVTAAHDQDYDIHTHGDNLVAYGYDGTRTVFTSASHERADVDVALAAATRPFVWNKSYTDHEQVRPYLPAFLEKFEEITSRTGRDFVYDDEMTGQIPALAGVNEETGIYMLQNLKRLDELDHDIVSFMEDGGREVSDADFEGGKILRGTVVEYGFYMGGTGWRQWDKARLVPTPHGPMVMPKGARTNGHYVNKEKLLIREG